MVGRASQDTGHCVCVGGRAGDEDKAGAAGSVLTAGSPLPPDVGRPRCNGSNEQGKSAAEGAGRRRDPRRGRGAAEGTRGAEPTAGGQEGEAGGGGTEQRPRSGLDGERLTPTVFTGQRGPVCPWGSVTQDPGLCRSPPLPRAYAPLTPSGKGRVEGIAKFHQHPRMSHPRSTQPGLKETHYPASPPGGRPRGEPREGCGPREGSPVPLKGYGPRGGKWSARPARTGAESLGTRLGVPLRPASSLGREGTERSRSAGSVASR